MCHSGSMSPTATPRNIIEALPEVEVEGQLMVLPPDPHNLLGSVQCAWHLPHAM